MVRIKSLGANTKVTAILSVLLLLSFFSGVVAADDSPPSDSVEIWYEVLPPSDDAHLDALAVSRGILSPSFDPETFEYSVSVSNDVTSTTFTPTARHPGASIAVDGQPVASGEESDPVYLIVGANDIEIHVTAQDDMTQLTYTITVTRAEALPPASPVPPPAPPPPQPPMEEIIIEVAHDEDTRVEFDDSSIIITIPAGSLPPVMLTIRPVLVEDRPGVRPGGSSLSEMYEIEFLVDGEKVKSFLYPITIFVKADLDDADQERVYAFVWDERLNRWIALPTEVDQQRGSVLATTRRLSMVTVIHDPGFPLLKDIAYHWAWADILLLASVDAISGYPDGTFRPGDLVTREQFARMLVDAAGISVRPVPRLISHMFEDFEDISEWARPYVEAAVSHQLIMGFEDDTFRPQEHVTRAQVAVMLSRSLGLTPVGELTFADADEIPDWAAGHIAALSELDIVRGLPGNLFMPHKQTTRAEGAAFLTRYLDARLRR